MQSSKKGVYYDPGNGKFSVPMLWEFALRRCLARSRSLVPICGSWSISFELSLTASGQITPNQQLLAHHAVSGSRDLALRYR
jgi:hypothetical protein